MSRFMRFGGVLLMALALLSIATVPGEAVAQDEIEALPDMIFFYKTLFPSCFGVCTGGYCCRVIYVPY